MSILLVTSFNKMIYELSGVRLIQSYFQHKIGIDLLITYEGDNDFLNNVANKKSNIKYFNLNNYTYLTDWLNENEDIIPTKYGGKYELHKLDSEIDIKLLNTFNSKMSLWFRKIASLKYALDTYRDIYDYIIWIDADTFFLQHLPKQHIINIFNNTYCFYHLGLYRAIRTLCSIESGFIGFKKEDGYKLLQLIIDKYDDKKFMKYNRWDDGHVIGQVIIDSDIKSYDVIDPSLQTLSPMDDGPFKEFIKHLKGTHHVHSKKKKCVSNYKEYETEILKYL